MFNERQEIRRTLGLEVHTIQNSLQGRTSRWEVSNLVHLFKYEFKKVTRKTDLLGPKLVYHQNFSLKIQVLSPKSVLSFNYSTRRFREVIFSTKTR
jgi:hypothetical protein